MLFYFMMWYDDKMVGITKVLWVFSTVNASIPYIRTKVKDSEVGKVRFRTVYELWKQGCSVIQIGGVPDMKVRGQPACPEV
jgi:hypothetical protein